MILPATRSILTKCPLRGFFTCTMSRFFAIQAPGLFELLCLPRKHSEKYRLGKRIVRQQNNQLGAGIILKLRKGIKTGGAATRPLPATPYSRLTSVFDPCLTTMDMPETGIARITLSANRSICATVAESLFVSATGAELTVCARAVSRAALDIATVITAIDAVSRTFT